jgi:predicted TPR repeat methyltransferase
MGFAFESSWPAARGDRTMTNIYADGTYLTQNPDWHVKDSGWKARQIANILKSNEIKFKSAVEVGCGAGAILEHLCKEWPDVEWWGYDISEAARTFWPKSGSTVQYRQDDFLADSRHFDLLLLIDVIEHVENYMGFLKGLSHRADYFVFHIPLDMHVSGLLRDRQMFSRKAVGHLHYFSQETANATLKDCGYRVLKSCLTKVSQETTENVRTLTRLTNLARRTIELVSEKQAAKLLGGYELLVLCSSADKV